MVGTRKTGDPSFPPFLVNQGGDSPNRWQMALMSQSGSRLKKPGGVILKWNKLVRVNLEFVELRNRSFWSVYDVNRKGRDQIGRG